VNALAPAEAVTWGVETAERAGLAPDMRGLIARAGGPWRGAESRQIPQALPGLGAGGFLFFQGGAGKGDWPRLLVPWPAHRPGRLADLSIATEDSLGKVDLGMKLTCESCGARFYDLNKTPAVCPKCGASNNRPAIFKTRGRAAAAEDREEKRAAAA